MKHGYYKKGDPRIEIFREILLNIMTASENDDMSDYIRYISLIKNMFPLSLSLIHHIVKHNTLLLNTNLNLKNNCNNKCLFPENKQEVWIDRTAGDHASTSEMIINDKLCENFWKYINDLQSVGLIGNYQIAEDNNNGEMYEYVDSNDEKTQTTYIMKTWKTKTYKYYLEETMQYIYDNFYTDDVVRKIEKQNEFNII